MKIFLPIILLMSLVAPTKAEIDEKEIARCATIVGDLSRLECFDELTEWHSLDEIQKKSTDLSDLGEWKVDIEVNPVDDSKKVTLILKSESGVGAYGDPVWMAIRCLSGETDIYIGWNSYLGMGSPTVLTRIGTKKATKRTWNRSGDSQATFHSRPRRFLKEILKEIGGSTSFLAQVTPYEENPITAIWDIAGLENAIKPVRETCSW
jgi:type VI secretion system protein VasI